jgi:hypothetical protein
LKTLQENFAGVHVVPGVCNDMGHDFFTCAAACPSTDVVVGGTCGLSQNKRDGNFMLRADKIRTKIVGNSYGCDFWQRDSIASTDLSVSAVCLKSLK